MWDQASSLAGAAIGELMASEELMERLTNQVRQRLGFARMAPDAGP